MGCACSVAVVTSDVPSSAPGGAPPRQEATLSADAKRVSIEVNKSEQQQQQQRDGGSNSSQSIGAEHGASDLPNTAALPTLIPRPPLRVLTLDSAGQLTSLTSPLSSSVSRQGSKIPYSKTLATLQRRRVARSACDVMPSPSPQGREGFVGLTSHSPSRTSPAQRSGGASPSTIRSAAGTFGGADTGRLPSSTSGVPANKRHSRPISADNALLAPTASSAARLAAADAKRQPGFRPTAAGVAETTFRLEFEGVVADYGDGSAADVSGTPLSPSTTALSEPMSGTHGGALNAGASGRGGGSRGRFRAGRRSSLNNNGSSSGDRPASAACASGAGGTAAAAGSSADDSSSAALALLPVSPASLADGGSGTVANYALSSPASEVSCRSSSARSSVRAAGGNRGSITGHVRGGVVTDRGAGALATAGIPGFTLTVPDVSVVDGGGEYDINTGGEQDTVASLLRSDARGEPAENIMHHLTSSPPKQEDGDAAVTSVPFLLDLHSSMAMTAMEALVPQHVLLRPPHSSSRDRNSEEVEGDSAVFIGEEDAGTIGTSAEDRGVAMAVIKPLELTPDAGSSSAAGAGTELASVADMVLDFNLDSSLTHPTITSASEAPSAVAVAAETVVNGGVLSGPEDVEVVVPLPQAETGQAATNPAAEAAAMVLPPAVVHQQQAHAGDSVASHLAQEHAHSDVSAAAQEGGQTTASGLNTSLLPPSAAPSPAHAHPHATTDSAGALLVDTHLTAGATAGPGDAGGGCSTKSGMSSSISITGSRRGSVRDTSRDGESVRSLLSREGEDGRGIESLSTPRRSPLTQRRALTAEAFNDQQDQEKDNTQPAVTVTSDHETTVLGEATAVMMTSVEVRKASSVLSPAHAITSPGRRPSRGTPPDRASSGGGGETVASLIAHYETAAATNAAAAAAAAGSPTASSGCGGGSGRRSPVAVARQQQQRGPGTS